MYTQISKSKFHDAFSVVRPNNFSYEGLDALFNYLTELEDGTDSKIELDVIALCCDYTEDSNEHHLSNYSLDSIEELAEHTTVIKVNDETSIIQDF
jgi:hypothetical protein